MFKKLLVVFSLFAISFSCFAKLAYVGHLNVNRYYPVAGTVTYLMLQGAHQKPAGCADSVYYAMTSDHGEFEEYRKLILTAKASGQKIGVYIWADPGKCVGSYPSIYSMFIQ